MAKWKAGDHVQVVRRPVSDEDRKKNRYFEHMADLTGTIQNVYSDTEIAVLVDPTSMSDVTATVHRAATERMRQKFLENTSEEQKKTLTKEELDFNANYVLLVQASDLVQK